MKKSFRALSRASHFLSFLLLILVTPAQVFAEDGPLPPLPQGPLILTSVRPEMLQPGYWIAKLPEANKVIKTPEELQEFNHDIHAMVKDCVDVFRLSYF